MKIINLLFAYFYALSFVSVIIFTIISPIHDIPYFTKVPILKKESCAFRKTCPVTIKLSSQSPTTTVFIPKNRIERYSVGDSIKVVYTLPSERITTIGDYNLLFFLRNVSLYVFITTSGILMSIQLLFYKSRHPAEGNDNFSKKNNTKWTIPQKRKI